MQFGVFAFTSVADTATSRRLYDLHDLDDRSVAKVMFHQRKQYTGCSEALRWDQLSLATVTLLEFDDGACHMQSLSRAAGQEADLLEAFYACALRQRRLLSWGGRGTDLALLRFRSFLLGVTAPLYWQHQSKDDNRYLGIADWLSGGSDDRPGLDETARRLGFPGLLGQAEQRCTDAWLVGEHGPAEAYGDLVALNTGLLAGRLLYLLGELSASDLGIAEAGLRAMLSESRSAHCVAFLDALGGA